MCPRDDQKKDPKSPANLPGTLIRPVGGLTEGLGEDPTILVPNDHRDIFRFLQSRGLISRPQALQLQQKIELGRESLAERLVEDGLPATAVATALGDFFGVPRAPTLQLDADQAALSQLSPRQWKRFRALPIAKTKTGIHLSTCDPSLTTLHAELEQALSKDVTWSIVPVPSLREAMARTLGPKLIVRPRKDVERSEHILRDGPLVLGKHATNPIVIQDPTVSRRHARLSEDATGRWQIEDLESANGTQVDGLRILAATPLRSGSLIRLGQTEIVFFDAEDDSGDKTADHSELPKVATGVATTILPKPSKDSLHQERASTKDLVASTGPAARVQEPASDPKPAKKKKKKKGKASKGKKSDTRMKAAWVRVGGQFIATLAAVLVPLFVLRVMDRDRQASRMETTGSKKVFRQPFPGQFEPSGVTQLDPGGNLLFVDDSKPGSIFRFRLDSRGRLEKGLIEEVPIVSTAVALDLEGMTYDSETGFVYVLSSHSLDPDGRGRESAVLALRQKGDGFESVSQVIDLRERLLDTYPWLAASADLTPEQGGLNLEAIAWDAERKRLLIGARSPLVDAFDGKAAWIVILQRRPGEADFVLDNAVLSSEPIYLGLAGLGIRAMEFDPVQKVFLLVAGGSREAGRFGIWEWTGSASDPARQISSVGFDKGQKPEGLVRVKLSNGRSPLLIVDDAGAYFLFSDRDLFF